MGLKIHIHDLKVQKCAELKGSVVIMPSELELPEMRGVEWHPWSLEYRLTKAGNLFLLSGELKAPVSLECSRCLKPTDTELNIEVNEQFSNQELEDDEIHVFRGDDLDLTGVLRDSILLSLPEKPLCSPECRGLCPYCGTDRNLHNCTCAPRETDPRLAVLEKLVRK